MRDNRIRKKRKRPAEVVYLFWRAQQRIADVKDSGGVDLYKIGMMQTVMDDLNELIAGRGAVRKILKKYE